MAGNICDVCGSMAVGVCSSSLGPISFAYCQECLAIGAEPYACLVGNLAMIGGLDGAADWLKPTIEASCQRAGKTAQDLEQDIKKAEEEMERYWNPPA